MTRCLFCQKPFGLVRKTFGALWWQKSYCTQECADNAAKQYQQQQRVLQFLQWLRS